MASRITSFILYHVDVLARSIWVGNKGVASVDIDGKKQAPPSRGLQRDSNCKGPALTANYSEIEYMHPTLRSPIVQMDPIACLNENHINFTHEKMSVVSSDTVSYIYDRYKW